MKAADWFAYTTIAVLVGLALYGFGTIINQLVEATCS